MKALYILFVFSTLPHIFAFAEAPKPMTLLILGDSLTEGYGVSQEMAFPVLLEKKLKERHPQKQIKVVNSGISGSTSASAVGRLKWVMKSKPDMVLVALGSNDGLRGVKVDEIKKNLTQAIDALKKEKVEVVLAGLKIPPNYGKTYTQEFEAIFPAIAKEEKLKFIPFLLEGVAGNPSLNQTDMIHPNEKGHAVMAEHLAKSLDPWL